MNFKSPHSFALLLLIALSFNNLHQWQPHAEDSVCEVCLLASHDADVPQTTEIHIQIATQSLYDWQQHDGQHINELSLIEPIRGSPFWS